MPGFFGNGLGSFSMMQRIRFKPNFGSGANWMFQQDNASCYTPKCIKEWFKKEKLIFYCGQVEVQVLILHKIFEVYYVAKFFANNK